jgi:nudix-type nucleoside diphosphatase (YffH/AdpP family)
MTRILQSRLVYDGYAKVTQLTLADDGGEAYRREVISRGQAVCVLPYDAERRVALLVRLPRAPLVFTGLGDQLLEAPASMIDAGETPEAAARREAMEETGLALGALEPVATCWSSPGMLDERTHLFLAPYGAGDRKGAGGGLAEEHEAITVVETPLTALWRAAEKGELEDLKTLALVFALRIRRAALFENSPI